jgi:hypothetical protein
MHRLLVLKARPRCQALNPTVQLDETIGREEMVARLYHTKDNE